MVGEGDSRWGKNYRVKGKKIKNGKEMKMGKKAKENYMNGGKRP